MKTYINKISSLLLLSLVVFFAACEDEQSLEITSPNATFELQEPAINSVFLNFGTPQNAAFTVSWKDGVTGSSTYDVEMSLNPEFTGAVNLGTVNVRNFTISVDELNTAIYDAGVTTFKDIAIYLRVKTAAAITNSVLFFVTTYAVDPAQFVSPAANDSYVLMLSMASQTAITVTWTDSFLGADLGDVNYTVEAAVAGTAFASPVVVGTLSNGTTINLNHADFNAVALGAGLAPDVAADLDLRIVAKTTNANDNVLTRISETLTISVTPYNVAFPNLYLVGDATTPNWNNNNNNTVIFRNQNVPNNYIYTGYFNVGAFKLLEVKGQWAPQWGTNDGSTLAVNNGGGSDPGTFNVTTAGYYTYNFTTVGETGSFTVTPYNASAATTYTAMGIIGDATPNGWGSDTFMTQDPNNPHLWFINGVTLVPNQMKFRANGAWADSWGASGSDTLYGNSQYNSSVNIPITDGGIYDIWFNDLDGRYVIILQ